MNYYGNNKKPFLTGPQMVVIGLVILVLIGIYWFLTAVPESTGDRQCLVDAYASQYTGGDFVDDYVNWKIQNGAITLESGKKCPSGYTEFATAKCVMCSPMKDKVPMSPELAKKVGEFNAKRAQGATSSTQEGPTAYEEE